MARREWTRREQLFALELYLRTPFGRIHSKNPEIIALAESLGRTANALALKMSNFAALDPTINRKGMGNYSKSDAAIWEEFFSAPAKFIDQLTKSPRLIDIEYIQAANNAEAFEVREGLDRTTLAKARINQDYFRKMLLVSYGAKCAATGIEQPELLVASHIVPWAENPASRLNPRNGILLNALHDRAFDRGFITLSDDLSIITSPHFEMSEMAKPFFSRARINKPERFAPDPDFLKFHRDKIFEKFLE